MRPQMMVLEDPRLGGGAEGGHSNV
jgi:hypothetical protein